MPVGLMSRLLLATISLCLASRAVSIRSREDVQRQEDLVAAQDRILRKRSVLLVVPEYSAKQELRILPWSSYTETVATALWFAVARAAWAHDVEELLKEDERKLRTAKELRELHGLVAEQQPLVARCVRGGASLPGNTAVTKLAHGPPATGVEASQRCASKETTLPAEANEGVKALEAARPVSAGEEEEAPDPLPHPPAEQKRPWLYASGRIVREWPPCA
ncbi:hypothetical protein AK812_SmicGene20012 [Symbiodinium microadriaticum]|uniref:Uncharacterized protein n=1 Tax=Symbiodinium microadriaticum TaxID=2951 RepID=A0A1Q9DR69_SYMMI|nr:hypothetical protein AK812_SmicGene20012 [Symbiodinium microadriaticum]